MHSSNQSLIASAIALTALALPAASKTYDEKTGFVGDYRSKFSRLSPTPTPFDPELREERVYRWEKNGIRENNLLVHLIKTAQERNVGDPKEPLIERHPKKSGSEHPGPEEQIDQKSAAKTTPDTLSKEVGLEFHLPFKQSSYQQAEDFSNNNGVGRQWSPQRHAKLTTPIRSTSPKIYRVSSSKLLVRRRREDPGTTTSAPRSFSAVKPSESANYQCSEDRSCRGRCMPGRALGSMNSSLQCFCDRDCNMFQDCCADYDDYCFATNTQGPDVQWECVSKRWANLDSEKYAGIWMISSCPETWRDEKVRLGCLQFPEDSGKAYDGPVSVATRNGATFKNRFCAECNGIKPHDMVYYDLYYQKMCSEQMPMIDCPFYWEAPAFTFRRYCLDLVFSCSLTNISSDIKHQCENGTYRVVSETRRRRPANFKNRFCMQCIAGKNRSATPDCGPRQNLEGIRKSAYFVPLFRRTTGPPNKQTSLQNTENIHDLALNILSNIGLSVSIFSLVLFILTYSLFSELRTLPGINVMNLSVSLLLLQSVWLATSQTGVPPVCASIAVSIHYFALVSFAWMSIIAFNTWHAFSKFHRLRLEGTSQKRKILRYMAMGWIPPLIFVVTCVILDKTRTFNIGYGVGSSCFIKNNRAGMYLLGVPVAVSVVFNAIFFVKTVLIIRRTKKQTRSVASQSQNRTSFKSYARLATLMGFTWVFGFLAFLISDHLLYPFVIFNTLQGVYIAVAYVLKRRVKALYIQLFNTKMARGTVPQNGAETTNSTLRSLQGDEQETAL